MIAPRPGSKRYEAVVKRGCGGYRDQFGEFDCPHEYPWSCDHCPCLIEKQKAQPGEE
jgi:hypothetical protein